MLTPAIIALLLIALIVFTALLFFGGAYVYYRGTHKGSPLPQTIHRILNPPAKPTEPEKPIPPVFSCPKCSKQHVWELSKNERQWVCKACGQGIPGPREKFGV